MELIVWRQAYFMYDLLKLGSSTIFNLIMTLLAKKLHFIVMEKKHTLTKFME